MLTKAGIRDLEAACRADQDRRLAEIASEMKKDESWPQPLYASLHQGYPATPIRGDDVVSRDMENGYARKEVKWGSFAAAVKPHPGYQAALDPGDDEDEEEEDYDDEWCHEGLMFSVGELIDACEAAGHPIGARGEATLLEQQRNQGSAPFVAVEEDHTFVCTHPNGSKTTLDTYSHIAWNRILDALETADAGTTVFSAESILQVFTPPPAVDHPDDLAKWPMCDVCKKPVEHYKPEKQADGTLLVRVTCHNKKWTFEVKPQDAWRDEPYLFFKPGYEDL